MHPMQKRFRILIGIAAVLVLAVGIYYLPPVHSRLAWRIDDLRTRIKYALNPPEEAIFIPAQQSQANLIVTQTQAALRTPTQTATMTPLPPDLPTATPTITLTPIPASEKLSGVVYVDQCNRWNYCGPSNLTMTLKFWGWKGDRDDVALAVKPGANEPNMSFIDRGKTDKNVMPYEMVDFVNDHTELRALYRYGGNIDLLKQLIAGGFPVIIEKGYYQVDYTGRRSWMGHYSFITGYDDVQASFIWQDTYPNHCEGDPKALGSNITIKYTDLEAGWRAFNYVFMVVYPPNSEAQVISLLGPWVDSAWAAQNALDIADQAIPSLSGNDLFFAWFNKGTSHVALYQYYDAAVAYDYAFTLYQQLNNDESQRPYRILWYETGPYWAYYYSYRYQDVINLANTTLTILTDKPSLEESLYWRGLAEYALGLYDAAYADMRKAVYWNQHFQAALAKLQEWGLSP